MIDEDKLNALELLGENVYLHKEIERLNKELEKLKQPQVFIDTQDMEERYGEELYKEYLEKENKRLNNIINELNNAYCKVITKCEEIIDSRFYMNDIAIKKYADEIKDICKYYVGKAKELKGSDKE